MQGVCRGLLFGGAIFCAGLNVGVAQGEVVNEQFRFIAEVNDRYEWDGVTYDAYNLPYYMSTGVNESFDVSGGLEIVPFDRRATGGADLDSGYPIPTWSAGITADVVENADGGLSASMSAGAGQVAYFFSSYGPSARARMSFTLTRGMNFSLFINSLGYSNDYGAGGVTLEEVGGDRIFTSLVAYHATDSTILVASGVLDPGDYTFAVAGFNLGRADATLVVSAIPAPGVGAALGLAGVMAWRRRRRGLVRTTSSG